jgi:hypothetical protein
MREEELATLDFHDSDCATHNEPAERNDQCNCWIESARNLLAKDYTDSEDHERFFSRYGANFLDAVDRVDAARAALSAYREDKGGAERTYSQAEVDAILRAAFPGDPARQTAEAAAPQPSQPVWRPDREAVVKTMVEMIYMVPPASVDELSAAERKAFEDCADAILALQPPTEDRGAAK